MSSTNSVSYSSYLASLYYDEKRNAESSTSATASKTTEVTKPAVDLSEIGLATKTTEVNKTYRDNSNTTLELIDSFENGDTVWACLDKTSTTKNPVVYVETVEQGVQKAYLVDVNKISLSDMSAVEAYGLARFVGGNVLATSDTLSGATSSTDAATQAKLMIANTDYLSAVKNGISNYQKGLDSASQNFQSSLFSTLGKSSSTSSSSTLSSLEEFFL
ncbi:MAG: hypothetical protein LBT31_02070 [Synergistaceae bacterium]|jgi:hypothetical protein|nr:hypothetical protein [Synergistaceae bacterium]